MKKVNVMLGYLVQPHILVLQTENKRFTVNLRPGRFKQTATTCGGDWRLTETESIKS
jgi:hypothetical protein